MGQGIRKRVGAHEVEQISLGELKMLGHRATASRITVGADKGYDTRDFVEALRLLKVTPHVAQNTSANRARCRVTHWVVPSAAARSPQNPHFLRPLRSAFKSKMWAKGVFVFSGATGTLPLPLPRPLAEAPRRVDLTPHQCYSGSFGGLLTAVDTWPVSDCKKATRSRCSWALRLKGLVSAESQGFLTPPLL